jgi:micrococcal nuclease
MRKVLAWLLSALVAFGLPAAYCRGQAPLLPPVAAAPAQVPTCKVLRVVDGDTVILLLDGQAVRVRLIGVNTPETVDPRKPVERFGREATRFLKELAEGKSVRVAYEPGPSRLDRYGRTLAYLYLEPGRLFINREIVARRYGFAYVKYPFQFMEDFRAAERSARENRLGLWAPEAGIAAHGPAEMTVYVTRTGKKYHRDGCRSLAKGAMEMPLDRAAVRYAPCAVCHPPVLEGSRSQH